MAPPHKKLEDAVRGLGSPSGQQSDANTITWTFAGLVLAALVGLIVLRHFKGTISIT